MDRITAIASIEYVREKCQILGEQESPHDFFGTICEALSMAIEALQEPERKKGQWIILSSDEDNTVCKCSVCGEDFVFYNGEFFPNYCEDCGSDMREVRQNERF